MNWPGKTGPGVSVHRDVRPDAAFANELAVEGEEQQKVFDDLYRWSSNSGVLIRTSSIDPYEVKWLRTTLLGYEISSVSLKVSFPESSHPDPPGSFDYWLDILSRWSDPQYHSFY